jgi:hypothetical protein
MEEQFMNAESPMLCTAAGIEILDRELHPANAPSPMVMTLFGMTTPFKLSQE